MTTQKQTSFVNRKALIAPLVCLCTLFFIRLFDLTVIRGDVFRARADDNRFFTKILLPNRGVLLDRHGKTLTENAPVYLTSEIVGKGKDRKRKVVPISSDQARSLAIATPSAVFIEPKRIYPAGMPFSHLIGFVGMISPDPLEHVISLDERVGKAGAEKLLDTVLRGNIGSRVYEISAGGQLGRIVKETNPKSGSDVRLTVDSDLTVFTYDQLQGKKGAVVVTDIEKNELLMMVSTPSYDIASYSSALSDPDHPLINRALSPYPPGSTFKMMTALAALEEKKLTKDTLILDEGEIQAGGSTFRNWYFRGYGRTEGEISVVKALARSNDIFFYKVAQSVGPIAIADIAQRFGLGKKTGIDLPEDTGGLVPTPAWKEKQIGEKWFLGDTYHYGIGQGYVLASPLQINLMTAAIARQGMYCTVRVVFGKSAECTETGVKLDHIETVIQGMVDACSEGGTAFPFFAENKQATPEKKVACKTGTAEFGSQNESGKRNTHAWFTMFYPIKKPKVAITVLLESTKEQAFLEGSSDAAPVAKSVWEEWKRRYE